MTTDPHISEREREILRLIATGATNQQIANTLAISVNTVKVHIRNLFGKIGVASRAEAAMHAVRMGLVRLEETPGAPVTRWPASESALGAGPEPEELPPEQSGSTGSAVEVVAEPSSVAPPAAPRSRAGIVGRWPVQLLLTIAALGLVAVTVVAAVRVPPSLVAPTPTSASIPLAQPSQRWRELPALPSGRAAFGLASYAYEGRSFLYAFGGAYGTSVGDEVVRFDLTTGVWVPMSRKPTAVADVRSAVVGGRIYVPGGRVEAGVLSNVLEAYDPQRDRWHALAPMPVPLSGYALAAVEGKLYVIGGWDGSAYRADVWQYNPDDDTWHRRASMPTARARAAAGVIDQQIYVVGGESAAGRLSVAERYSPATDGGGAEPWSTKAPLPVPVGRSDAAVAGGLLMVVGGDSATGRLLVYSPQTDSWDSSQIPFPSLRDARVQTVAGRLYIVGGAGDGGASARVFEYQAISSVFLPAIP